MTACSDYEVIFRHKGAFFDQAPLDLSRDPFFQSLCSELFSLLPQMQNKQKSKMVRESIIPRLSSACLVMGKKLKEVEPHSGI